MKRGTPQPDITWETFVNRDEELARIGGAIEADGFQIVNIQGEGGIGKTSLLRKVSRDYSKRSDLSVTSILDFFSTTTHTRGGFLAMLVDEFPGAFQQYREERNEFDILRLAGVPRHMVKRQREKANQAFRNEFNRLAESQRLVLLIDTFEVVQDSMGTWLRDLIYELAKEAPSETKEAVFIVAGRRNKEWQGELEESCLGDAVTYFELSPLKEEAVKELCQEIVSEPDVEISVAERGKLHLLSGGQPLLLSISLDWYRRPDGIFFDHLTETTAKYELAELRGMSDAELRQVRKDFETELMTTFLRMEQIDRIILSMAHVYKRFDANVLSYLEDLSEEKAQEILDGIQQWPFIKYDPRTHTYQLHDKMRDMVLKHVSARLYPDHSKRQDLAAKMVKYYDTLLREIEQRIEQKIDERRKAVKRGDREADATARREEIELRTRQNVLSAHQAYYNILAEPEEGLLRCNEAIVDDIWAFNDAGRSLKRRERKEALNLLGIELPEYVTDLERARVLTVIEQNRQEALNLLEELDDPRVFSLPEMEKRTHQADVKIYQSINIGYLPPLGELSPNDEPELYRLVQEWIGEESPLERAVERAQEAIDILRKQEKLDLAAAERQAIDRSLARAYHAQAYPLARMGRLIESIKALESGLGYARRGELPAAQSHALNDLAFGYARLGQFSVAIDLAEEGLRIRERLGLDHFVGLSKNTLGAIKFLNDQPHRGRRHSEQALRIFERLDDRRGKGLALLALGKINGRIGEVGTAEEFLEESLEHYEKAEEIFSTPDEKGRLPEPARLPETYEWLGILHLIWGGSFLAELGAEPSEIASQLTKAERFFEKAVRGYEAQGRRWEQAIALERWARVYTDRGEFLHLSQEEKQEEFSRAEEKLSQAETIVLKEAPEIELKPLDANEVDKEIQSAHPEYRLALGKVERLRGRLAFDHIRDVWSEEKREDYLEKAALHFTLACAYLQDFSEEAGELRAALDLVGERIPLLEYQEIKLFEGNIKKVQKEYGLQGYNRLLQRIEVIASIEHIA